MTIDETTRQRALDTYRAVDTLPEEAYDDIARLAALLCDAPTALVSLIDRDRQWLKARTGFDLEQTPRDIAFCDHAIRTPDRLFEVPDATADPRFAGNPLVTADNGVRFYAGMPLVTPAGASIGTVCVLDARPRELDERQRLGLAALARLTMNLLEGRLRLRELERSDVLESMLEAAVTASPAPAAGPPPLATVAVFELQGHAAAVQARGERAVERMLHELDEALGEGLRFDHGDSLHRSTGSPETIVLLHGSDAAKRLAALRERCAAFEAASGMHIVSAAATAEHPDEALPAVFARADEALSAAKDDAAQARSRPAPVPLD